MSKDVFADYPEAPYATGDPVVNRGKYFSLKIRPEPVFEDEFVLGEWAAEAIPAPADVPPGLTESEERALWGDR